MALATVTVDASALARAARALGGAAEQIQRDLDALVRARLRAAETDLRAHTPRAVREPAEPQHTPHMGDLWQTSLFGPASGAVGNTAAYTDFLFAPTRAHEIRARSAGTLHFFAGGSEVFAPVVQHPGTQPSVPLSAALHRQIDLAEADLAALGARVTTQIAAQVQTP